MRGWVAAFYLWNTVTVSTIYTWSMEKLPVSRENARTIIRIALRRGPVYVFDDEADTAAKESVRALLAHWPDVFKDAESEDQHHAE